MPRRTYIVDLQKLSHNSGIDGISNVRQGQDDDEFRFCMSLDNGTEVDISVLVLPNVGEYPSNHYFQLYLADDGAPASIASTLSNLPCMKGKDVRSLIESVSKALSLDSDGDCSMIDSQALEEADSDDDSEDYDDFNDANYFNPAGVHQAPTTSHTRTTAAFRSRMRYDLRTTKKAGFKIGHKGTLSNGDSGYVCISSRISKLGLSEEAMQTWNIHGDQYLILVIYYPNGYRSADAIAEYDTTTAGRNIQFRLGLSDTYRPTADELANMFHLSSYKPHDTVKTTNNVKQKGESQETEDQAPEVPGGWHNCFISGPLNQLFNDRFIGILKLRNKTGMSWTGAEIFFHEIQGSHGMAQYEGLDDKYLKQDKISSAFPAIVTADHIQDSMRSQEQSLPLLAMQFALRHFVRCTEFCLVCHCKLETNVEALKPYVCESPLCLYQYMSLGFGPSIEHEIRTQPYVVDLLVSFCYSSAFFGRLKDFPTGLSLLVPDPNFTPREKIQYPSSHIAPNVLPAAPSDVPEPLKPVKFNETLMELTYQKGRNIGLRTGDWVALGDEKAANSALRHFRVVEVLGPVVRLVMAAEEQPDGSRSSQALRQDTKDASDYINSTQIVYKYDRNFDDLSAEFKRAVIVDQLNVLPSVSDMAKYLTVHKMNNLSMWHNRISPAALSILRWIIASNRACIMQIDKSSEEMGDVRIHGMSGWMQYRFAMGAPDKEQRFLAAMKETARRKSLKFPSCFAFHGSPLYNWHSIIREGLHFNHVVHGRAFGNGVYHSLSFHTSQGYTGQIYTSSGNSSWMQSELQISCAMALNELVNASDEFVSRTPHLVVNQLHWIQTRYLFVRCMKNAQPATNVSGANPAASTAPPDIPIKDQFLQDPQMTPMGETGRIVIPMKAVPRSRRPDQKVIMSKAAPSNASKKVKVEVVEDHASISTLEDDRDLLLSEEDEDNSAGVYNFEDTDEYAPIDWFDDENNADVFVSLSPRSRLSKLEKTMNAADKSGKSGFFSSIKSKLSISSGSATSSKLAMTDFIPGQLDHSTLPVLPPPRNATPMAAQQLMKRFNAAKKTQEKTPLHELGWYIDPNHFNNVFQWIVELHSFPAELPLANQLREMKLTSIVLELRFTDQFPYAPPFARVIRPRFVPFSRGGGGHVTAGGSLCMELLTNNGWSAVSDIESVLLQIRLALCSTDPVPAQLERGGVASYSVSEAVDGYIRSATMHGWTIPAGFTNSVLQMDTAAQGVGNGAP